MKLVSLQEFGKAFIPERLRPRLRKYLLKAGISEVPYSLFGLFFAIIIIATALVYIICLFPLISKLGPIMLFLLTFASWLVIPLALAVVTMFFIYLYLDLIISERTKKIEDVLDDFLLLVSESLKGGMGLDRALWASIKPEFGVLAREIEVASKRVATGEDVEDALREFIQKYDSPMTKRAFELIIEEAHSGGQLAFIIDKVVDDIKETKLLKADMVATNIQYVMFITIIVLVISPLLFSLSYQLLTILMKFSAKLGPAMSVTSGTLPFTLSEFKINLQDFVTFSRISIGMVAVFSAMIVSEINKGSIKGGIKYLPWYLGISLVVYHLFMLGFSATFGGFAF